MTTAFLVSFYLPISLLVYVLDSRLCVMRIRCILCLDYTPLKMKKKMSQKLCRIFPQFLNEIS